MTSGWDPGRTFLSEMKGMNGDEGDNPIMRPAFEFSRPMTGPTTRTSPSFRCKKIQPIAPTSQDNGSGG